ncbi:GNAT family N-acetyltransferase [Corynebacterium sp. Q4381]|uniref:GNAT family N-acetyltransferase n=1 Tax=Corynebacterium sp. Marseille-Q4381 TaxID=3121597 RepID=UPI002FE5CA62
MTHPEFNTEFKTLDDMTAREAYELFKLRVDVFVAEQDCPFNELDEVDAASDTFHILARDASGRLAGCARVFPEVRDGVPHARFGRFVVAPYARGTGVGPEIVRAGLEFTRRWPGDLVIEAQTGLVGYYNRFGLVEEGEEFLDGSIPHVLMRKRRS